jgi:RsiW-degrading membrane proteinase PrsW (M82 family)
MGYFVLALAPVFIIAFYIYFKDKYEKEPLGILLIALLSGVFISLPVMLTESFFSFIGQGLTGFAKAGWDAFMVAALNEEAFKLVALTILIWKSREFNEKFDGIVYASFISLGFAGIENVLYVFQHGYATGVVRAITAVPAHALFGITMGFFFGMAKFYPAKRTKYLRLSFFLPFMLHGIYDFILMSGHAILLLVFVPFIIYLWISGFRRMKQMNNASYFRNDLHLGIDFSKVREYNPENQK